jgi:hypothetical protein
MAIDKEMWNDALAGANVCEKLLQALGASVCEGRNTLVGASSTWIISPKSIFSELLAIFRSNPMVDDRLA